MYLHIFLYVYTYLFRVFIRRSIRMLERILDAFGLMYREDNRVNFCTYNTN